MGPSTMVGPTMGPWELLALYWRSESGDIAVRLPPSDQPHQRCGHVLHDQLVCHGVIVAVVHIGDALLAVVQDAIHRVATVALPGDRATHCAAKIVGRDRRIETAQLAEVSHCVVERAERIASLAGEDETCG